MQDLAAQVQTYLQIYDPLGLGELAPPEQLYGPVVAEIVEKLTAVQSAEEAAQAIHRVLYLTYGNQAGPVRNYADLGRDLFRLVQQGA
ncbi:hypothetical protein [Meiothermus taiwanensis]|jgi:hypothetical protein|uniref:DUF1871 domain-containing protein n=2 Tax=Meiothermus taiwanensis TaxID=172827 RepID=A0A399E651_9DEIN|nr:hypothetical protein [Meiothermus taiwanensis]AWR86874.1 hypothetical protein Mtai_v1c16350 [Meiothermus taiwanensis WR-220]KIQ55040.1 hypothetical protein SY28_05585 [Meiothermus taiwanensis]KZK14768.1 hypothetical protein A3962_03500 [Meiothermus taiwanensis]RIH79408.1 hypothetical protein Mcate_00405 [Meiothermus taiwanensis]